MLPDAIPHIQQFSGAWSIYQPTAASFLSLINSMDWSAHFSQVQSRVDKGENAWDARGFDRTANGIAVVDLEGVLTKYGSSVSQQGSTVSFRKTLRSVRDAHESGDIKAAMIVIESGGGSTMGTPEAAAEVAALASRMPVWTYFEDIGASAAYWIGSQASNVVANESALIGSIGSYFAVNDVSAMFEKAGVKANLFSTGEHKGAGHPGTEVTEPQSAEFRSLLTRINQPFPDAVAKARGFDSEQIKAVNDGRVWRGAEAVSLGLIDAVMSYDEALAELASLVSPETSSKGSRTMSAKPKVTDTKSTRIKAKSEDMKDEEDTSAEEDEVEDAESMDEEDEKNEKTEPSSKSKARPRAKAKTLRPTTTIASLREAVPDADSDFLLGALESGMAPADAKAAWMEQTIKAQQEQIDELKSSRPGVSPLGRGKSSSEVTGDPIAQWDEAKKRCGSVSKAVAEHPELQAAYLEAMNAKRFANA